MHSLGFYPAAVGGDSFCPQLVGPWNQLPPGLVGLAGKRSQELAVQPDLDLGQPGRYGETDLQLLVFGRSAG